jgi:hypothetical protein
MVVRKPPSESPDSGADTESAEIKTERFKSLTKGLFGCESAWKFDPLTG